MREFLFTLTYENLTDKKELNFIVGETSAPPTWNTVKAHVTKITRAFDSDALKSRRIYFSATERLTGISIDATGDATMSGAEVDFSQDGKTESEITKADAPGIMVPANSYYVYVYDDAGKLVKQQEVTTAGYPDKSSDFTEQVGSSSVRTSGAEIGEYLWGMDGWKDANGDYAVVKDVKVKQREVFFLPLRLHAPIDWDINGATNSYCTVIYGENMQLRRLTAGGTIETLATFTPSSVGPDEKLLRFRDSPALFTGLLDDSEKDEILDVMYLAQVRREGSAETYDIHLQCFDALGNVLLPTDAYGSIFFTQITE